MAYSNLIRDLSRIVGSKGVLSSRDDLMLYEYDGLSVERLPDAVVFPSGTEQVVKLVNLAREKDLPVVARGAGTGLSGGAVAAQGGLVISFARMKKILEVDFENERAVVQPGLVNQDLTSKVSDHGYCFAPDPSSQKACTIGGNVAENSGGPHTLAYGVTTNHVLGLEVVLPNGDVIHAGGKAWEGPGYDLKALVVGSEGTLGIVTKVVVRLMRLPEAVKTLLVIYNRVADATHTVADVTAQRITPAAIEMMDNMVLKAVEEATHAGYPIDAAAVLLIELEGLKESVEVQAEQIREVCLTNNAREVRLARSEEERELLWRGRKNAFGALGRISPSFYVQDGVIPRTRLPEMLEFMEEVSRKYDLRIGNVFHAGDGNIHPLLLFDRRKSEESVKVLKAAKEIMNFCVAQGGSLSGEHGIGLEKNELMPLVFSEDDLDAMRKVRGAFGKGANLNPGKLFPTGKICGELRVQISAGE